MQNEYLQAGLYQYPQTPDMYTQVSAQYQQGYYISQSTQEKIGLENLKTSNSMLINNQRFDHDLKMLELSTQKKMELEDLKTSNATALNQERFEHDKEILALKNDLYISRSLLSISILQGDDGILYYAAQVPDGEKRYIQPLLNIANYRTYLYHSCHHSVTKAVLMVTYDNDNHTESRFYCDAQTMNAKDFRSKLTCNGIALQVPSRKQKEVLDYLIAFSFSNAKHIELPYSYGWNKNSEGDWHFSNRGEFTMREVLTYASR